MTFGKTRRNKVRLNSITIAFVFLSDEWFAYFSAKNNIVITLDPNSLRKDNTRNGLGLSSEPYFTDRTTVNIVFHLFHEKCIFEKINPFCASKVYMNISGSKLSAMSLNVLSLYFSYKFDLKDKCTQTAHNSSLHMLSSIVDLIPCGLKVFICKTFRVDFAQSWRAITKVIHYITGAKDRLFLRVIYVLNKHFGKGLSQSSVTL